MEKIDAWEPLLTAVVNVNSGTANTEGSERVRRLFIPEFEKLGFQATIHDVGSDHKVVSFDHRNKTSQKILFVGHLDTVFPKGNAFSSLTKDGDKLRGPGVIDMKGGIVLMLAVLSELDDEHRSRIRIMLNDDEEIGSPFSKERLKSLAKGIAFGMVFEPGLAQGEIVTSHSGVSWVEVKVKGKAAHAGLEHHKGLNACVELSHKITQMAALTDYSKQLTINPGVVAGGTTANTVCEDASVKIDVRYVDNRDLSELMEKLGSITKLMTVSNESGERPTAELTVLERLPSMPSSSSEKFFAIAKSAAASVKQNVVGTWVGYASDANHLAETGMQLLVGLGPFGDNMHSKHEYLSRSSFAERLELNKAIIRAVLEADR